MDTFICRIQILLLKMMCKTTITIFILVLALLSGCINDENSPGIPSSYIDIFLISGLSICDSLSITVSDVRFFKGSNWIEANIMPNPITIHLYKKNYRQPKLFACGMFQNVERYTKLKFHIDTIQTHLSLEKYNVSLQPHLALVYNMNLIPPRYIVYSD